MSKIITKKQLKMVMENTIKEADYINENEDAIKLTKDHMDKLHKEGHCMCDDKCLIYIEDIAGDVKKMTELIKKIDSEDKDCVFISKEQMDMLHKDGKCDCDDNVTLSYDDDMKEGDYMGDGMKEESNFEVVDASTADIPELKTFVKNVLDKKYDEDILKNILNVLNGRGTKEGLRDIALKLAESDNMDDGMKENKEMCSECGGNMVEGVCEGCSGMSEELHGGQKELDKNNNGKIDSEDLAIMRGDKVKESVNELTESLNKTTNTNILKEDMDFFNKMINYNKK